MLVYCPIMEADKSQNDLWIFSKNDVQVDTENLAPEPYANFYDMIHENRGIAMIFNQVNFSIQARKRDGSDKDRDALQELLAELKFDVRTYNDLNVDEIQEAIADVAKMDHSNNDCVLICIMTHGDNGILYGKDGPFPTSNLWKPFTGSKCPTLAGKPKLFFIQACRGQGIDEGVELKCREKISDQVDASEPMEITYKIPVMADILVMYSTNEGYYSWRDPVLGTYFIQSLVVELRNYHNKRDLMTLLTFVNRKVAVDFKSEESRPEYSGNKQMCSIVSMLTRLILFDKK